MLLSLGLDFRRAGLDVRERFHLDDPDVPRVCTALAERGVEETVLTRTCNRVEVYCWWPGAAGDPDPGRAIGLAWVGGDAGEGEVLRANAALRAGADAARHLFRVAAGLESQILGDVHILGQLRRAFRDAVAAGSLGSHLHRLFETALRVGKQVKRETGLTSTRNSVGAAAARRAALRFGGLAGRACVVVGCGKSGTHAARTLCELGATAVALVNRTVDRAEKLARELPSARAAGLDALPGLLAGADVVVVATRAQAPILSAAAIRGPRASAPLLVIDISVPRNVEGAVGAVPGVELVDLDSLHPEAAEGERSRLRAVPRAEALVAEGTGEFVRWLELQDARRALRPLHAVLSEVCRREVAHLAGASELAERTAGRIVASVMAHPMAALRAASARGEALLPVGALGSLFADPTRSGPGSGGRRGRAEVREASSRGPAEAFPRQRALAPSP
jgi:glutamyl-tRNA reductase